MADYSTMSPSLASNNDGSDEEPTQTLRYVMGIFMLLITLFVLFFAFWTYMIHIKRMFSQCWKSFRQNGIRCCCHCLKNTGESGAEDGGGGGSTSASDLLNSIIFDPDDEQKSSLTESLLSS